MSDEWDRVLAEERERLRQQEILREFEEYLGIPRKVPTKTVKCECGSAFTSRPSWHSEYCPLYKKKK